MSESSPYSSVNKRCIMDWEHEKEEKTEALNSWIDATSEELEFANELCDILEDVPSKNAFIKLTKSRLEKHNNPWLQNNLRAIVSLVVE